MPFTSAQLQAGAAYSLDRYVGMGVTRPEAMFSMRPSASQAKPVMSETDQLLRSNMIGASLLIGLALSAAAWIAMAVGG
jgi:hypothetical protein